MYEVRKVSADWNHPTNSRGMYLPLHQGLFKEITPEDWIDDDGTLMVSEVNFDNIPEAQRTHYQLYEDYTAGTPMSPVFATEDELITWCTENIPGGFVPLMEDSQIESTIRTAILFGYSSLSGIVQNELDIKPNVMKELVAKLKESIVTTNLSRAAWEQLVIIGHCSTLYIELDKEKKTIGVTVGAAPEPSYHVPLPEDAIINKEPYYDESKQ